MKKKSPIPVELLMVMAIAYLVVQSYRSHNKLKELVAIQEEQHQEYEELTEEISKLEEDISHSGSLKYIERIAREEYGMVKPKEIIFIDMDKGNNKESVME